MDTREVQQLLDDLEPRIERLKSLYQQYFMGIEKIPPHVLRKDVERSLWRLRRQRLQTTRLRFKFQQIVQRYNTYQQHWARIMRDIERGTFKRDVVRAARRFGEGDALAEVGRAARAALERELHEEKAAAAPTWEIDEEEFGAVVPLARPGSDFAPAPRTWELSDADVLPGLTAAVPAVSPPIPQPPPAREVAARPPPATPGALAARPPATPGALAARPPATPGALPARPGPPPPLRPPPPPPGRGAAAPGDASARAPRPPPPRRGSPPPPAPTRTAPANPEAAPKVPAAPTRPVRPKPQAAARPTDRTRQLYDDYLQARRATGEKVDNLSYDALQRSLQRQTERLRRQHGNREVDFEVVTKDGRALIRPVIK